MKKKNRYRQNMKWRARTTAKILQAKQAVYKEILALQQRKDSVAHMPELITAKEVQALFAIAHSTYYRWIKAGWLTPALVGGRHYYRKAEIIALLEKRRYRNRGGFG